MTVYVSVIYPSETSDSSGYFDSSGSEDKTDNSQLCGVFSNIPGLHIPHLISNGSFG